MTNDQRVVYAWVTKIDGGAWSLIGMANEHGHLPMISHNVEMLVGLRSIALEHGRQTGQPVQLVKWTAMDVIEHHNFD